jgi:hypothetical protein
MTWAEAAVAVITMDITIDLVILLFMVDLVLNDLQDGRQY